MGVRVFMPDLRSVGICKKSRFWFERHGFDFKDLRECNGGIDIDLLYATGDQMAQVSLLEQAALRREARSRG